MDPRRVIKDVSGVIDRRAFINGAFAVAGVALIAAAVPPPAPAPKAEVDLAHMASVGVPFEVLASHGCETPAELWERHPELFPIPQDACYYLAERDLNILGWIALFSHRDFPERRPLEWIVCYGTAGQPVAMAHDAERTVIYPGWTEEFRPTDWPELTRFELYPGGLIP